MHDFVHLHVRSHCSYMASSVRVRELVPRVAELGMPAVALTDRDSMAGAIDLYTRARRAGIRPILGFAATMASCAAGEVDGDARHEMLLLAAGIEGYRNLCRLVRAAGDARAATGRSGLELASLAEHSAGLVLLTGGLRGGLARLLMRGERDAARERLCLLRDALGPERVFVELRGNETHEEREANRGLVELARAEGAPIVATADVRHLRPEDREAYEVLRAIGRGGRVSEEASPEQEPARLHLASPDEMAARFGELPEALSATLRVAEICDVEIDAGTVRMPKLERGLGQSAAALLAEKVAAGLRRRLGDAGEDTGVKGVSIYEERVRRELTVIEEVGFTDYFLVVADYVRWAREAGVPVGPGRGSVGGSVVAWALRITEIDPIRHGLLFERFMNAERANAPVISVDLCPVRRLEVADYISRRHGIEKVAWVGEHEEILGGALVGDVADALGMSGARIERIRDLVPSHRWSSVRYASEHDEELRDLVSRDAAYARLLALADQLWGLYRGPTAHPPNLVISDEPLAGIVPATRDVRGLLTTQYGRYDVEDLGFFPLELLGLEVLTVLDHAEKLVRQGPVPRFCLESIPLDGEEAFELISSGDTGDIFQVGSAGFRELLAWLQPSCFEDLCAAVALYRPGGLGSGMLADFGKRKRGEAEVLYPHPILEGCLKETYGVMVYQEQVMRAVVEVAGFTMDGADLLRRALGTKKADDVEKMRCLFLEGAAERGLGAGEAGEIFSALEHYAGYGFNKAHSVAYCLLTYRCAYLKAHFPDLYSEAVERCASGPSSG